jgi:hypothetical protein
VVSEVIRKPENNQNLKLSKEMLFFDVTDTAIYNKEIIPTNK